MTWAIVQLGAGPVQRGLLERIRESGLVPVIVDRSERPAGLVPGALHVRAPIDEPRAIAKALREARSDRLAGMEVGAVLTSTDLGVSSVPAVAKTLGLPHASPASIASMDDKARAREILGAAKVRVPTGWLGRRPSDIPTLEDDRDWIVKPVDSSGSRGVRRIRGAAALAHAIDNALDFSDRFLVEECVDGLHLDINGLVVDGRFELVSIGRRHFTRPPACVPIYGGIAGGWDTSLAERVTRVMQASVAAFDYRHGPVKADLIEGERGLVVLELAARFHGDVFSHHVAEAAGLPPAALVWLARLGLCPKPTERPRHGGWFGIFAEKAGTIRAIEGLDEVRSLPGFRTWIPRLGPGDEVGSPEDNRALVGFGLIGFDETADLWAEADRRRRMIQVTLG